MIPMRKARKQQTKNAFIHYFLSWIPAFLIGFVVRMMPMRKAGKQETKNAFIHYFLSWIPAFLIGFVGASEDSRHMQRTLILLKPDCVQRRLIGEVILRFERKGLRLVGMKLVQASRELAEKHYAVHMGKPFYDSLLKFI